MDYRDLDPNADEVSLPRPETREGLLDPQMTFSARGIEAPQLVARIVKRSGATEAFDKAKIADAIYRAAQSAGGPDRDHAGGVAAGVAIYLGKQCRGEPATVEQVDDAVEKVLLAMGHARTALSYARFRRRRARARRLRARDAPAVLGRLAESQRAREVGDAPGDPLFVRTSAETLAGWDPARIVDALVRETGLDEKTATVIALEVERQLASAKVRTLTAPLVRELVNAKLIEHGLEDHWRRHMRLGVPLYDAERIICGLDAEAAPLDPEATGRVLADSVKRAYALSHVFSSDVADAHLSGDLYVHDLGRVDCLRAATQSLAAIARFGVGLPDTPSFSKPAKRPDGLLAQMVNASGALERHFAGATTWYAANVFFAPFLEGLDEPSLRQVAQMLIYEYAYRAAARHEGALRTEVMVCWDVPSHLESAAAAGPGGADSTRSYGAYAHPVQQFAWAVFDVLKEGGVGGAPFPAPTPLVQVGPAFFKSAGHDAFLGHVSEVAARGGNVHFLLEREGWLTDGAEPWESRDVSVQQVTLNLPRAAYRARDEAHLMRELAGLTETAARAHAQKRAFMERLFALEGLGPLALLAMRRDGRPAVDLERAAYLVGLTGLNECVQAVTGRQLHESAEARALGLRLVRAVADACREWSERLDLRLLPAHAADPLVDRRFAALDLESDPDAAGGVAKSDPATHDVFYTAGTRAAASAEVSPMERARIEGAFHDAAPANALTAVRVSDSETSPRAISDFVQKAYHQTSCRRIAIEK